MPVAFTNQPIAYQLHIDGTTSAALRTALHNIAIEVGWPFTAITGGYEYRFISPAPQALQAKLRIWDPGTYTGGTGTYLNVQMRSFDDSNIGCLHHLGFDLLGREYWVWANCCQLFVAIPGFSSAQYDAAGVYHHAVACGIPYVPEGLTGTCAQDFGTQPDVTDAWWSCGSTDSATSDNRNFRNSPECTFNPTLGGQPPRFSYCWNSTMRNTDTEGLLFIFEPLACLRLIPMTPTFNLNLTPPTRARMVKRNDNPLLVDPLMTWSDRGITTLTLRGQLYDACLSTCFSDIDEEVLIDDGTVRRLAVNYMRSHAPDIVLQQGYDSFYCSLYLFYGPALGPPGEGFGNVAY